MLFPTVQFAIFFPIVLAISWALMTRQALWKPFIVFASYVFYACANPRFCLLLGGITLGNQAGAKLIHRTAGRARAQVDRRRRGRRSTCCVLAVFKYYGFFTQSIADALDTVGLGMPLPLLTIALPVGVSFFTFQAISYTVDVKRRLVEPASTIDVALYLSFFPHLVAGPIVRAREFLPQLQAPRDPSKVAVGSGLALIGLGLIKKVVIADYLARTIVDPVFARPGGLRRRRTCGWPPTPTRRRSTATSRGYTDIAIGLALLLGYVFPQNFMSPVPVARLPRLLAPLAHDALALPARLPLHPARRQPQGQVQDLPQPVPDDAARRPLARRGVDVRALGRVPRRRARRSSTRSRTQWETRLEVAALGDHVPPRRLRLDPVPRAEPGPGGDLHLAAVRAGLGDAMVRPGRRRGAWS